MDDLVGGLSGAVANAGVMRVKPFLELTPKIWRDVMAVNLDGTFHFVHPVSQRMATRGYGSIVILASASSRMPSFATSVYNTSKTALSRSISSHMGVSTTPVTYALLRN